MIILRDIWGWRLRWWWWWWWWWRWQWQRQWQMTNDIETQLGWIIQCFLVNWWNFAGLCAWLEMRLGLKKPVGFDWFPPEWRYSRFLHYPTFSYRYNIKRKVCLSTRIRIMFPCIDNCPVVKSLDQGKPFEFWWKHGRKSPKKMHLQYNPHETQDEHLIYCVRTRLSDTNSISSVFFFFRIFTVYYMVVFEKKRSKHLCFITFFAILKACFQNAGVALERKIQNSRIDVRTVGIIRGWSAWLR